MVLLQSDIIEDPYLVMMMMTIILIIIKKNGHLALVLYVEYMGGDNHTHANGCHDANLGSDDDYFHAHDAHDGDDVVEKTVVVLVMMTIIVLVSNQETKFVLVWVLRKT